MKTDVIVLGAGMVGISAALHLQARGRSVVLADRRPAAEETSFGNSGIIQREGVVPYTFPRNIKKIAAYALNRLPEANLHWRAVPWLTPFLYQYWRHGTPERIAATARGAKPLVERCIEEHAGLMADAGITAMMRRTGYIKVFRSAERYAAELAADEVARARYGVNREPKTEAQIRELEPSLAGPFAGGILIPDPVSVADPGAVGKAYAELFQKRGGQFLTSDARTLERTRGGWQIQRVEGAVEARAVVVALGPWSADVLAGVGVRVPMGVKRGYHMHYAALGNASLARPVVDGDNGYLICPMTRGIRLTTGAEFALRDSAPTPAQLGKVESEARALFPLGDRVDERPWIGARPCFPDMLPMIGEAPRHSGLWVDTGHHHLGFTLGPVSGRLLADMMTGAAPFTDPAPYRVGRFG